MHSALSTTELLTIILSYLDIHELTRARQVSRQWAATIQHAPTLRKITFHYSRYDYEGRYIISLHPCFRGGEWMTAGKYSIQILTARLKPNFSPRPNEPWIKYCLRDVCTLTVLSDPELKREVHETRTAWRMGPIASCWDALATQPPADRLIVTLAVAKEGLRNDDSLWCAKADPSFQFSTVHTVAFSGGGRAGGVTVGDVMKTIWARLESEA